VQFWDNNGSMGAIVYAWGTNAMEVLWGGANLQNGSGFVSMQTGQVITQNTTDRHDQITQMFNSNNNMGFVYYAYTPQGLISVGSEVSTQGYGNSCIISGNVLGAQNFQVIQFWNNSNNMGCIIYAPGELGTAN